jgi:hypothetical protein
MLVPRLSPQATKEMHEVEALIAATPLHQWPDTRYSKFIGPTNKLNTSGLYRVSTHSGENSRINNFVWGNYTPQEYVSLVAAST